MKNKAQLSSFLYKELGVKNRGELIKYFLGQASG
jgi:hypothetical protein